MNLSQWKHLLQDAAGPWGNLRLMIQTTAPTAIADLKTTDAYLSTIHSQFSSPSARTSADLGVCPLAGESGSSSPRFLSPWLPCPPQARFAALVNLLSQLVRGVSGDIQWVTWVSNVIYQSHRVKAVCYSCRSVLVTPAKTITSLLACWSLYSRSPK